MTAPQTLPITLGIELRRRITKLAQLLSGTNRTLTQPIRVLFSGSNARTDGQVIYLPALPDLAEYPTPLADAMLGVAVHEAAHILFSDFSATRLCAKTWPEPEQAQLRTLHYALANAIEDCRIERLMMQRWPGTRRFLQAIRHHSTTIDRISDLTPESLAPIAPILLVLAGIRINNYHVPLATRAIESLSPEVRAIFETWAGRMQILLSTQHSIEVAETILRDLIALSHKPNQNPKNKSNKTSTPEPDTQPTTDPDHQPAMPRGGTSTPDQQTPRPQDPTSPPDLSGSAPVTNQPNPTDNHQDKNQRRPRQSDPDPQHPARDTAPNDHPGGADPQEPQTNPTHQAGHHARPGEDICEQTPDPSGRNDADPTNHNEKPDSPDALGTDLADPTATHTDPATSTTSPNARAPQPADHSSTNTGTSDTGKETEDTYPTTTSNPAPGSGNETAKRRLEADATALARILEQQDIIDGELNPEQVLNQIDNINSTTPGDSSDAHKHEPVDLTGYSMPQRPQDYLQPTPDPNPEDYQKAHALKSQVRSVVQQTARILRRHLLSENSRFEYPSQPDGQFDIRNLNDIIRSTGNCYSQVRYRKGTETLFTLLIDISGSMKDAADSIDQPDLSRLELALQSALAIEQATQQTHIKTTILTFTSLGGPVDLRLIKTARMPAARTAARIAAIQHLKNGGTPTGRALQILVPTLLVQPIQRHILAIITDGKAEDPHIAEAAIRIAERRGIECHVIGIGMYSPITWATNRRIIQNIEQLPMALLDVLKISHKKKKHAQAQT